MFSKLEKINSFFTDANQNNGIQLDFIQQKLSMEIYKLSRVFKIL